MSLALNNPKLDNLADEIWKSAERLRGKFKAHEYQNVVLSSFTGASRQGLSHKELGLISIPLPSIGVQRNVVADLERLKSQQKQVRDNIGLQIDVLVSYRKSLIHECVTGQRRIAETEVQWAIHALPTERPSR